MTIPLAERLRSAKVYDLEQPRYYGMPIFPFRPSRSSS